MIARGAAVRCAAVITLSVGTLSVATFAAPVAATQAIARAGPILRPSVSEHTGRRTVAASGLIPLPRPRPAEAPRSSDATRKGEPLEPEPNEAAKGTEKDQAEKPPLSACRQALTEWIAIAPSIPPIKGPGACGGNDLVRLEAVVLPDKSQVALRPAATLRCTMAAAIADWVRTDVSTLASSLGTSVKEVDNFDSFECRGRNRVVGAQLSEHGKANALDVRSLKLADGRVIGLTDRTVDRSLRETVLQSVCARFTTVLGPSSDWYHEDHVHLDLAERRNGYRICHWDVLDPLPAVAPMLPVPRPDDAPPREAKDKTASPGQGEATGDGAGPKEQPSQEEPAAQEPAGKKKGRPSKAPLSSGLRKSL